MDWTKVGTLVGIVGIAGLWVQIYLTGLALGSTGDANRIAQNAQRAWIRVKARPRLIRGTGLKGLYIRVDFVAENTGQTAANHFGLYHRMFFRPHGETGPEISEEMMAQVDEWKAGHRDRSVSSLLPNDEQVSADWKTFKAEEIQWTERVLVGEVAQPMLLAAVIYRTAFAPDVLQVSWRTWYLNALDDDGQMLSYIPRRTEALGPKDLCVDSYHMSMFHEEHADAEKRA